MFELFMYEYSCNAARFFSVDRALNVYFVITIMSWQSTEHVSDVM